MRIGGLGATVWQERWKIHCRRVGRRVGKGGPKPVFDARRRVRRAHAVRLAKALAGGLRRVGTAECAPCKKLEFLAAFAHPTTLPTLRLKSPKLHQRAKNR